MPESHRDGWARTPEKYGNDPSTRRSRDTPVAPRTRSATANGDPAASLQAGGPGFHSPCLRAGLGTLMREPRPFASGVDLLDGDRGTRRKEGVVQLHLLQLLTNRDIDQHDGLDRVAWVDVVQEGVSVGVGHHRRARVRLILAVADESLDLAGVEHLRLLTVVGNRDVDGAVLALGLGWKRPTTCLQPALDRLNHEREVTILDGLANLASDRSRNFVSGSNVLDRGVKHGDRRSVDGKGDDESSHRQDDRRDGETLAGALTTRLDQTDNAEDQAQEGEEAAEDVDDWDEGSQSAQEGEDKTGDSQAVRLLDLAPELLLRCWGNLLVMRHCW